jgi:hypothetical protein
MLSDWRKPRLERVRLRVDGRGPATKLRSPRNTEIKMKSKLKPKPKPEVTVDVIQWRNLRDAGNFSDETIAKKLGIDLKTLALLEKSVASWGSDKF